MSSALFAFHFQSNFAFFDGLIFLNVIHSHSIFQYILTLFFFNLSVQAILMLLLESPSPAFSSMSSLWMMRSSQLPPPHLHLQMPQKQLGSLYLCVFPCCSFSTMDNKYRNEVVVTPTDERRQREERQRNNQQDERPGRDLTRGSSCQSTQSTAP